jgi:hypothetical protein
MNGELKFSCAKMPGVAFEGNGDFRMKLSKCNNFGLYRILSTVLFSFYF